MTSHPAENPSKAPPDDELIQKALEWLQTDVLKIIITRLIPLIVGTSAVSVILVWLQDKLGIDLTPAEIVAFLSTIAVPLTGMIFAYIKNHIGATGLAQTALMAAHEQKMGQQQERVAKLNYDTQKLIRAAKDEQLSRKAARPLLEESTDDADTSEAPRSAQLANTAMQLDLPKDRVVEAPPVPDVGDADAAARDGEPDGTPRSGQSFSRDF